jgi:large subunit ribosomal protein L10
LTKISFTPILERLSIIFQYSIFLNLLNILISSPTMAVSHSQKVTILNTLENQVATQKAVLILSTNGAEATLNSELTTKIRQQARKAGVVIKVVKNTLVSKTFKDLPTLRGQTYIAYLENGELSNEITVPKEIVGIVSKDFKENFLLLGSYINGEYFDVAKTQQLAQTPTLDVSIAKIAGSINQIATKLALVIKEIPSSVARGVSEATKQNA